MNFGKILKLVCVLSLAAFLPSGMAAKLQPNPDAKVIYKFRENLENAQAWVMGEKTAKGKWAGGRFVFPELALPFEIRPGKMPYEGTLKDGIFVTLAQDNPARIIFPEVPTGSMIVIEGGVEDGTIQTPTQKSATIYFTVWAGKKRLKRIAMPATGGWQKTVISFGAAQFLISKIPVSFTVSIDDDSRRNFSFDGFILQ